MWREGWTLAGLWVACVPLQGRACHRSPPPSPRKPRSEVVRWRRPRGAAERAGGRGRASVQDRGPVPPHTGTATFPSLLVLQSERGVNISLLNGL